MHKKIFWFGVALLIVFLLVFALAAFINTAPNSPPAGAVVLTGQDNNKNTAVADVGKDSRLLKEEKIIYVLLIAGVVIAVIAYRYFINSKKEGWPVK